MGLEPTCNQLPFLQGISLRGYPSIFSTPDRSRTYDLLLRRQLLYPAELREHAVILAVRA